MPEPRRRTRHVRVALRFLLLGLAVTTISSFALWWVRDPVSAAMRSSISSGHTEAARSLAGADWLAERWTCVGAQLTRSVASPAQLRPWSPGQATGAPDTPRMADLRTAWASRTADGQPEWLILTFTSPVNAARVRVIESNAPGAIVRVGVKGPADAPGRDADWHTIYAAPAPATPTPAPQPPLIPIALDFPLPPGAPPIVTQVRIDLDSPGVPGWNEIDAVALVTPDAALHWADAAEASSTYADAMNAGAAVGSPESLVPSWASIPGASADAPAPHDLLFASYGFPWPAFAGACDLSPIVRPGNDFTAADILPLARADSSPRLVPWRPLPLGLLLNTLAAAALLAALSLIALAPLRITREVHRLRRGRCIRCGYDLRFDFAKGCPECGFLRP